MDNATIRNEPVTVGVCNCNGENSVRETLASIKNLDYPDFAIMVCDDASTDRSVELISEDFPDVQIIQHQHRRGLSAVRNTLIKNCTTSLIFIVDNDITLDSQCLRLLVGEMRRQPKAFVVTPRIVFSDRPYVQSDGCEFHYLCTAIHYNRNAPLESLRDDPEVMKVCWGSGGMMLLDKRLTQDVGWFDEDFVFGWTDAELMIRATFRGLICYTVPRALVYHHAKIWGTKRAYFQMRNRWFVMLINYSWRTLFVIAPALALHEMLLLLFMTAKGKTLDYLRSMWHVLRAFPRIVQKRKAVQLHKVLSDGAVLRGGDMTVDKGLMNHPALLLAKRIINGIFNGYWSAAIRLNLIAK